VYAWFTMAKNSYQFLARQPAIHNTLAKSVTDKKTRDNIREKFRIETVKNKIITHYKSPNQHCGLYIALAQWIIDYYRDKATMKETRCMKSGDPECEIYIQWQLLRNQK